MAQSTVLVYGSEGHISLRLIYERLLLRGVRRSIFLIQERFPSELGITYDTSTSGAHSWVTLDEGQLATEDIISVAVDGYYVPADAQLSQQDSQYSQIEGWAALVGYFHHLSRSSLLVNHVTERDYLSSRWGELCLLAGRGLPVPAALVTSDPQEARAFYQSQGGQVLCKPVTGFTFRPVEEADLERFDRLKLCPIHFEVMPSGWIGRLLIMGKATYLLPQDGTQLPPEISEKCLKLCQDLGLVFAEVTLRHHDGHWLATGLRRFLSPEVLSQIEVLDAACAILETGKAALQ